MNNSNLSLILGASGSIGRALDCVLPNAVAVGRRDMGNVYDKYIQIDLRDPVQFDQLPKHQDSIVYGLAAGTRTRIDDQQGFMQLSNNNLITNNMLAYAAENHSRFIFFSTGAVCEPLASCYMSEDCVRMPVNWYTLSKSIGEDLCAIFRVRHGLSVTVVRLFNIFGFGVNRYVVHEIAKNIRSGIENGNKELIIHSSGQEIRDFSNTDFVTDAIIRIAQEGEEEDVINIGSGLGITIREVVLAIADALNYKGKIVFQSSQINKLDHPGFIAKTEKLQKYIDCPKHKDDILSDIQRTVLAL